MIKSLYIAFVNYKDEAFIEREQKLCIETNFCSLQVGTGDLEGGLLSAIPGSSPDFLGDPGHVI